MAETATAEKATRGKGPIQVTFIDDKGKADYRRVPNVVTGIRVASNGKHVDFPTTKDKPDSMDARFAAYGKATRIKLFVTHNIDEKGTNALDLAKQLMGDFNEGKMYARAEGSGERRGKVYDPTIYVEATKLAHNEMFEKKIKNAAGQLVASKPATQDQMNKLRDKLMANTPKERNEWQRKQKANPYYAKQLALLQAKQIETTDADALF